MTEFNKQLNQAKAPLDLSKTVLEKIKNDKIRMTERWKFLAKKLGLGGGLALTALVLIILINLILYWIQSKGLIYYLGFDLPAFTFILKRLPFIYFAIALILLLIINFFINKTSLIYKKYYRIILIIIWVVIIGGGFFLFYTNINNYFEQQVALSEKKIFLLSKIYQGNLPCLSQDKDGLVGKVIEINNDSLTLQTLDNQQTIKVVGQHQLFISIKKGQIIAAIGTGGETFFVADKIKVITPEIINSCLGQY